MKTFYHLGLICFLFFLSISHPHHTHSQHLRFEHLSARQGLPTNWVWALCQDREGFMWFGTYDGLYKYDGQTATNYVLNPADPSHSLRSNLISAIHEDQKGRLWVGTWGGGLHQVDKRTGQAKAFPINAHKSSPGDQLNSVYSIYEDKQGILWLGTFLGIARFDPDTWAYRLFPTPNRKGIITIREDSQGKLWAGSYRLDPKTGRYSLFPLVTPAGNRLASTIGFDVDAEGIAWVGVEGGLYRMDIHRPGRYTPYNPNGLINKSLIRVHVQDGYLWLGSTQGLQKVNTKTDEVVTYRSDPSQPGSLSNEFISSLFWDKDENLWVGLVNGVNKASTKPKPFQAYQIVPTPSAFHQLENEIFSVVEDKDGLIWVSSAGHGLYRMDPQRQSFARVVVNPLDKVNAGLRSGGWPLLEDRQGQLWVGTGNDGLYKLDRASGKFLGYPCRFSVRMLDEDGSGRIWVGGVTSELASFDTLTKRFTYYQTNEKDSTSLISGFINDLMVSRKGDVWLATTTGVGRLNPVTGRSIRYEPDYRSPGGGINDPHAMALYEDEAGIIWIGTHGGGLNRLDPKTNTFTHFTTRQGLPSNRVMSLLGDENENLWLGTGYGLSRLDPRTKAVRNFDMSDGLPGNEFLERGSVFRRNGKLLFGSKDGLVIFHPDSIRDRASPPPVFITDFEVMEESLPVPDDEIVLPYDENFISFRFVAINYDAPDKNRYAYRLEGLDKDWVNSGSGRLAHYTDLDPGTYHFGVKASSDGSTWNEKGKLLTIIILPPWWRTWWAYAFYTLCLIAIVLAVDKSQRKRLLQKEREKARERELEQAHKIEEAYKELKQTQLQLIQAEKMASLGELTSGIAHEIQNPLNFVNNFSEVNKELIGEMKQELKAGNVEEVLAIADALEQNLKKVNHHGRRADSIVKGMLQHSRTSAGQKEPTDLNALADEYLRLSYSGFRAKHKDFSCTLDTAYDQNLRKVEVVPQELGRVLLNLFHNAFYALQQKQLLGLAGYEPKVAVSTAARNGKAQIRVWDNGTGIAESVKGKIFQPFFTTKPTGQGTGLGLSLSYDIITKGHGGELAVASEQGEWAEFTITLPSVPAAREPTLHTAPH
jgi:ligand-binding sensor domain-containing protein/signal transduction histidine kinase